MGTENLLCTIYQRLVKPLVKLNNPLMGTENSYVVPYRIIHQNYAVKLNNPLMGTENKDALYESASYDWELN